VLTNASSSERNDSACSGVGVHSALQCGWDWGSQCAAVRLRLGLGLTVHNSAVGIGVHSAVGWGTAVGLPSEGVLFGTEAVDGKR